MKKYFISIFSFCLHLINYVVSQEVNENQPTKEEVAECDRYLVEESIVQEEAESLSSTDETRESPTLASAGELSDLPTSANTDMSSMDAMSTISDVSNIAVVPSENCSFLDEPIEEDFGSEIGQQEESTMGDSTLFENEDLVGNEPVASGSAKEEEGITLSPEEVKSKSPKCDYTDVRGVKKLMATPKPAPSTPKADYTNVDGVKQLLQTPKVTRAEYEADYTNVAGIKYIMKTPKPPQKEPESDYTDVEGVGDLLKTPKANAETKTPKSQKTPIQVCETENVEKHGTPEKSSPEIDEEEFLKSPPGEIPDSPPAEQVEIEEELLDETVVRSPEKSPESAVDEEELVESPVDEKPDSPTTEEEESCPKASSPQADYTDVRGVKQTPKPPPVTPKADYSDVSGIRRLMKTPKESADYTDVDGIELLMKTPRAEEEKVRKPSVSPDSGCQTPSTETPLEAEGVVLEEIGDFMEETAAKVEETPRRGRKGTPRVATPKPKSRREKLSIPEVELEEQIEEEEEAEEPTEIPPVTEDVVQEETVSPPRQKAAPTPKANTPKPRSKRGQDVEVVLEAAPELTVAAVMEETPSKAEEEIPRRGGRTPYTPKPRSKRGKREDEEVEVRKVCYVIKFQD